MEQYFGPKQININNVHAGMLVERILIPSQEYINKNIGIARFDGGGCPCTGKPVVGLTRLAGKQIKVSYKLPDVILDGKHTKVFAIHYTNGTKESYILDITL